MSIFHLVCKLKFKKRPVTLLLSLIFACLFATFSFLLVLSLHYRHKIFQGVVIDTIAVGGLSKQQALSKLRQQPSSLPNFELILHVDDIRQTVSSQDFIIGKKYHQAVDRAFQVGRIGSTPDQVKALLQLSSKPQVFHSHYQFDRSQLKYTLQQLKQEVDQSSTTPSAQLKKSGHKDSIVIDPGQDGRELLMAASLKQILSKLRQQPVTQVEQRSEPLVVAVQMASISARLDQEQLAQAESRVKKLVGKKAVFRHQAQSNQTQARSDKASDSDSTSNHASASANASSTISLSTLQPTELDLLPDKPNPTFILNDQDLVSLLALPHGYDQAQIEKQVRTWLKQVNRPPTNAQFEYNPQTLEVTKFQAPRPGWTLDAKATKQQLTQVLQQIEQQPGQTTSQTQQNSEAKQAEGVEAQTEQTKTQAGQASAQTQQAIFEQNLAIKQAEPEIKLSDTNNLGINSLIGVGDSHYDHSIPSRIHNVKITADKLSHTIVPPDQEFSFNQAIGEVSAATGYKPAYIIKNGRTELSGGGGVCQVSTTMFRALLDAGLDITLRLPHSYRVSYYELDRKPGFDATVYAGDTDLRFINDTDHHLLIYSEADSKDLYMRVEIYGYDDGRTTVVNNYQKWGYQPPPPTQYIPDPSLPPGTLKQIDWSASGIKAKFDWTVRDKNGEIIRQKTFKSSYQPWSAKYLQGV